VSRPRLLFVYRD